MVRIGRDRIGVPPETPAPGSPPPFAPDRCPVDGARGEFRRMALVCPRCGRLLGGC